MTVQNTNTSATFNGANSTGPFPFTFRFFQDSDIIVNRTTNGITTTLVENAAYTLTGAGTYSGGAVTLTSALVPGEILTVYRRLPLTQLTSIRNLAAFYPEIHEDVFDRITMILQQINEIAETSKIVVSTVTTGAMTAITSNASAGPTTVDIAGLGIVIVTKDDATANTVTIHDSSGATILRQSSYTLYGLDEWVTLMQVGNNWKRIG